MAAASRTVIPQGMFELAEKHPEWKDMLNEFKRMVQKVDADKLHLVQRAADMQRWVEEHDDEMLKVAKEKEILSMELTTLKEQIEQGLGRDGLLEMHKLEIVRLREDLDKTRMDLARVTEERDEETKTADQLFDELELHKKDAEEVVSAMAVMRSHMEEGSSELLLLDEELATLKGLVDEGLRSLRDELIGELNEVQEEARMVFDRAASRLEYGGNSTFGKSNGVGANGQLDVLRQSAMEAERKLDDALEEKRMANERCAEAERKLADLKRTCAEMERQREEAVQKALGAERKLTEAGTKLARQESDGRLLDGQRAETERQLADEVAKSKVAEAELSRVQALKAELQRRLAETSKMNETLEKKNVDLLGQIASLRSEVADLDQQLAASRAGGKDAPEANGTSTAHERLVQDYEKQLADLRQQLEAEKQLGQKLSEQLKTTHTENSSLRTKVHKLEDQLRDSAMAFGGLGARQDGNVDDGYQLMQEDLRRLEAENARLQALLKDAQSQNEKLRAGVAGTETGNDALERHQQGQPPPSGAQGSSQVTSPTRPLRVMTAEGLMPFTMFSQDDLQRLGSPVLHSGSSHEVLPTPRLSTLAKSGSEDALAQSPISTTAPSVATVHPTHHREIVDRILAGFAAIRQDIAVLGSNPHASTDLRSPSSTPKPSAASIDPHMDNGNAAAFFQPRMSQHSTNPSPYDPTTSQASAFGGHGPLGSGVHPGGGPVPSLRSSMAAVQPSMLAAQVAWLTERLAALSADLRLVDMTLANSMALPQHHPQTPANADASYGQWQRSDGLLNGAAAASAYVSGSQPSSSEIESRIQFDSLRQQVALLAAHNEALARAVLGAHEGINPGGFHTHRGDERATGGGVAEGHSVATIHAASSRGIAATNSLMDSSALSSTIGGHRLMDANNPTSANNVGVFVDANTPNSFIISGTSDSKTSNLLSSLRAYGDMGNGGLQYALLQHPLPMSVSQSASIFSISPAASHLLSSSAYQTPSPMSKAQTPSRDSTLIYSPGFLTSNSGMEETSRHLVKQASSVSSFGSHSQATSLAPSSAGYAKDGNQGASKLVSISPSLQPFAPPSIRHTFANNHETRQGSRILH